MAKNRRPLFIDHSRWLSPEDRLKWVIRSMSKKFQAKAEFYRTNKIDLHGINTALYVAMLDCEDVCTKTLGELK